MSWIRSYGCVTAAGPSVESLWRALQSGADLSQITETGLRAFPFRDNKAVTQRESLTKALHTSFMEMCERLDPATRGALSAGAGVGVILASTKGFSQDFIWADESAEFQSDPLTPLLEDTILATGMKPERSICVSNACSSGLAAMRLGQEWLKQGLQHVVIFGADAVTKFVLLGFQSLKLVSEHRPAPFDRARSGLFLGEAAATLCLSRERSDAAVFALPVGLDTESSAITRPTLSGESLVRAAQRIPGFSRPDFIVAHGTGTVINDQTEDLAFSKLFEDSPWITGTKWAIGHTLGVSALVDTIAACEILRRQKFFPLGTTEIVDPSFRGRFVQNSNLNEANSAPLKTALVSSLGFGGMHASLLLEARA